MSNSQETAGELMLVGVGAAFVSMALFPVLFYAGMVAADIAGALILIAVACVLGIVRGLMSLVRKTGVAYREQRFRHAMRRIHLDSERQWARHQAAEKRRQEAWARWEQEQAQEAAAKARAAEQAEQAARAARIAETARRYHENQPVAEAPQDAFSVSPVFGQPSYRIVDVTYRR